MDKKSKIFFAVFFLLIAVSVAATYYRYIIKRDCIVHAEVDCDPETEACFIWECDPESEEEGEACTGDPDEDIWYYKIIKKNAQNIPLCDPNEEECEELSCEPGEEDCEEILCSEGELEEGEVCSDPETYLMEYGEEEGGEEEWETDGESEEVSGDGSEGGEETGGETEAPELPAEGADKQEADEAEESVQNVLPAEDVKPVM